MIIGNRAEQEWRGVQGTSKHTKFGAAVSGNSFIFGNTLCTYIKDSNIQDYSIYKVIYHYQIRSTIQLNANIK